MGKSGQGATRRPRTTVSNRRLSQPSPLWPLGKNGMVQEDHFQGSSPSEDPLRQMTAENDENMRFPRELDPLPPIHRLAEGVVE
jgi:hypothetical protein